MGLDWNPIAKPQPGFEAEFDLLFKQLGALPVNVSWFAKVLRRVKGINREAIDRRWREIQITPYETLQAPQVGVSPTATEWMEQRYAELKSPDKTREAFMREMQGYYVLQLVPSCDGLPYYTHGSLGYVELFSFRAQFLQDSEHAIGEQTFAKCYQTTLAPGLAELGKALRERAEAYAEENNVAHVAGLDRHEYLPGSVEFKAHVMFAAARWCEYWSSRGHGMEAYW